MRPSVSHRRTPPALLGLIASLTLLVSLDGTAKLWTVMALSGAASVHKSSWGALGTAVPPPAQPTAGQAPEGSAGSLQGEKGGEAEPESPHELLYKIINFLILAGGLGYLLRKPLADFFHQRAQTITESLQQGRHALAAAQDRLSAIEAKLANLDAEIRAFKDSAAREMEAERQRLRQAAQEESERTLAFARMQMEVATRAAALELKRYTALEAVGLAEGIIRQRLDDQGRRRLVSRFIEGLGGRTN